MHYAYTYTPVLYRSILPTVLTLGLIYIFRLFCKHLAEIITCIIYNFFLLFTEASCGPARSCVSINHEIN